MEVTSRHLTSVPIPRQNFGGEPTPRLFHYTTLNGVMGILETKELWATNIHYLNDAEEFRHGIKILTNVAEQKLNRASLNERVFLSEILRVSNSFGDAWVHVVSFAEHPDLLSQWRGYSAGGGVSIGFDFFKLMERASRHGFRLIKCIYDDGTKETIVHENLEASLMEFRAVPDPNQEQAATAVARFMYGIYQLVSSFKNSAFQEEQEWRLVSDYTTIQHPMIGVRAARSLLIPYRRLPLSSAEFSVGKRDLAINGMIISPSHQSHKLIGGAWVMAEKNNVEIGQIIESAIPYRSL